METQLVLQNSSIDFDVHRRIKKSQDQGNGLRYSSELEDTLRGSIHIIDIVERIYYPSFTYQFPLKLFYTEIDCVY